jgi:hypothetical protein
VVGGAAVTKTARVMTKAEATPLIKKLTLQCKRKVDDLITCLLSENATVRLRAREILHIIAETNLAGAIARIDDKDLDLLYEVNKKLKTDETYRKNAKHQEEFKRRKSAIKEIVSGQLAGIGGLGEHAPRPRRRRTPGPAVAGRARRGAPGRHAPGALGR